MNELEKIVARTRSDLAARRREVPLAELERRAQERAGVRAQERAGVGDTRDFFDALARPGMSIIAEHKRRSPSAGVIREGARLEEIVSAYERAGAAALSVLTDGPSFGGSLEDLRAARGASGLPILRKDFIVDPYQVLEAYAGGADAILLIVAALTPEELSSLHGQARELGLATLVEVHDREELRVASAAGVPIIGVNNRDLTTLQVDTGRTYELLADMPAEAVIVAESGFRSRRDVEQLADAGVDAVLIGEALMRAPDIEAACRGLARI